MASAKPLSKTKPEPKKTSAGKKPLQKKLEVGSSGDRFEREADHVARQVARGNGAVTIPPTISPLGVQRKKMNEAAPKKEEEKKSAKAASHKVQRKPTPSAPKKEDEKKGSKGSGHKVQRKSASSAPKKDDEKKGGKGSKKAQRKEAGAAPAVGGAASSSVESAIGQMQSRSGSRLDGGTRGFMESRFGRDFSGVRVHHGNDAAAAAKSLNARAFTVGNDVFFNSGEYSPHNTAGRELLAHELTHTVQQAGTAGVASRKRVQRVDGKKKKGPDKLPVPDGGEIPFQVDVGGGKEAGLIRTATKPREIVLPYLNLPLVDGVAKGTFAKDKMDPKAKNGTLPELGKQYQVTGSTERVGVAADKWLVEGATLFSKDLEKALTDKLPKDNSETAKSPPKSKPIQVGGGGAYLLGFASPGEVVEKNNSFIFGSLPDLAKSRALLLPQWSKKSGTSKYQVDHILELQIGGADEMANMWLLDSDFNQASGNAIKNKILADISTALDDVDSKYDLSKTNLPKAPIIKQQWTVTFNKVRDDKRMPKTSNYWSRDEIKRGDQLKPLKFLNSRDLAKRDFKPLGKEGKPTLIYVFPTPNGGRMSKLAVKGDDLVVEGSGFLFPNMMIDSGKISDKPDVLASIFVTWTKGKKNAKGKPEKKKGKLVREAAPKTVEMPKLPGFYDVGFITREAVRDAKDGWDLTGMSPVNFKDVELDQDGYLVGSGILGTDKPLLPKLKADLVMDPNEVRIDFPIPKESFSLGPFNVTSLAMSLGIGDDGPFVRGAAEFDIATLGSGSIIADVGKEGPTIKGRFNLALDFFDKAFVDVEYKFATDELIASGTLSVPKGRLPGVESGTCKVDITRDSVGVDGTINLAAPLSGTSIRVTYSKDKGLTVGAENIQLPLAKLPAVQNATISISATRSPTGEWSIGGTGQASLAVPGATGSVAITYLDGLITFRTLAQVAKGPATGTLDFTATNGTIDDKGQPNPPPTDNITAWGKGSVTIMFGKIIQGTAGVELTPDNRVILAGEIGLPPVYEVFKRYDYKKDLLHLEPPEFPIWGVSIAGHGIGVFAFVDARISADAWVGPGQIRDAAVSATMDLDHPEQATVHGHGQFYVPAFAGLSLDVGGGLRARAAIAFAEGRVGLKGELGIAADASASIDIDWNPSAGLSLETNVAAHARPQFILSANASVTVGVDLLLTDISHTFGPWEKELGSFGPDMELGVEFPVRWSEAKGLDLSLDNIVVHKPSLDAPKLMSSVFDALAA